VSVSGSAEALMVDEKIATVWLLGMAFAGVGFARRRLSA
jgi:hypothetical protein